MTMLMVLAVLIQHSVSNDNVSLIHMIGSLVKMQANCGGIEFTSKLRYILALFPTVILQCFSHI